jgi:hypothetical protein
MRRRQASTAHRREADVDSLHQTAAAAPRTAGRGEPLTPDAIGSLHRSAGNAAVTSLLVAVQRDVFSDAAKENARLTKAFDEEIRGWQVDNERSQTLINIVGGETDENKLTNAIFYDRHKGLEGHTLDPKKRSERGYVDDWLSIREHIVRPVLADWKKPPADDAAVPDI